MDSEGKTMQVGREAALAAFRFSSIPADSPIAHFAGQRRAANDKGVSHFSRSNSDTPEDKLRRGMGYDQVHATQTRTTKFSKPNLSELQELTGYIHRAIADLGPLEFLWIQYRYRPAGPARRAQWESFRRAYFARYEVSNLQGCKSGTRAMVRYLIAVAMENEISPGLEIHPAGHNMSPRNWNKTYRPHWVRICEQLTKLDGEALYKIGGKIDLRFGVA